MRRLAVLGLAGLLCLSACKKDVSGSYLVNDNAAVCWLQVVRTPDDHLTGQLVLSELKPDGTIDHQSVSLNGAVNGENVTLTGGGLFGLSTTTLSGTFDGNALTLAGVQSAPFTLKRASLADYQAQLSQQTTRSQAIISARATAAARQRTFQAQKSFVAQIDQIVSGMQRFDADADSHLARFPNAEKGYEAITAKVNEYVTRERQLVGNPDRAVDRSQLYVSANQASLDTDQMHYHAQDLQSSLQMNITPMVNEVAALEQRCHQDGSIATNLTPAEMEAHRDACNRLLSAAPMFQQKYAAMVSGLNNLEGVYKREKDAQAKLLAQAQQIE